VLNRSLQRTPIRRPCDLAPRVWVDSKLSCVLDLEGVHARADDDEAVEGQAECFLGEPDELFDGACDDVLAVFEAAAETGEGEDEGRGWGEDSLFPDRLGEEELGEGDRDGHVPGSLVYVSTAG
jgi:hypothetical protein